MSSAVVDRLNRHMAHVRDVLADDDTPFGRPDLMEKAVAVIRARVNGTGGTVGADRIRDALALVERKGIQAACDTHLRYLCWALNEPWRDGPTLLGRPDGTIQVLLERAGTALQDGMLPLSAWRGLLAGYLGLDARPAGGILRGAWLAVREFLAKTLDRVCKKAKFQPDWLNALVKHRAILGDDPCGAYASSVFAGETQVLTPLRDAVGIPEQSWFWQELVLSQVKVLCELPDDRYLKALDRFLPTLEGYPTLADDALVMILDRHHRSLASQPHQGLQDFAVSHWGSPYREAPGGWLLVEPSVKAMVREWIVRRDLKLFFDLLSADGASDQRRLNFWLQFAGQVDIPRFVLGDAAFSNPTADYARLRKEGRAARLTSPGSPDNNAFILTIGNHVFVEFGQPPNAAYGYRKSNLPFDINARVLDLKWDLKDKDRARFWLPHNHGWEEKFMAELAEEGIYPEDCIRPNGARQRDLHDVRRMTSAGTSPKQASHPQGRPNDNWAQAAKDVAAFHGLRVEDKRAQGGCLWVRTNNARHPARPELEGLGFKFTPERGFWRKR